MSNKRLITVPLSAIDKLTSRVEILPLKENIETNDGRAFQLINPVNVIAASTKDGIDMLVDYEHDSLDDNKGSLRSVAAGWIKKLSVSDKAIVGDVEWTSEARSKIEKGEYRYLSPTLITDEQGVILRIKNVALTNEPALPLEARLSQQDHISPLKPTEADKEQLISALREHYEIPDASSSEIETALSNVSRLAQQDVDEARGRYFLPRAIEDELLLVRQTVGSERFKSVVEKLSQSGMGFGHLKQYQTEGMTIHTLTTNDQRTQAEKEACEATGISQEQFQKAKGKTQ